MKKPVYIILFLIIANGSFAQDSTRTAIIDTAKISMMRDPRLDLLAKKELEFNTLGLKAAKGFRLLVMSSNDRDKVMVVRAKLLQQFPDQKVYMTFQVPYIKLKFGNFIEKPEAEKYRDQITKARIVTTNVYVVPEVVEVKADKLNEKKDDE